MRRAWAARDVDLLGEALAEDVVLHSPILSRPFVGRDGALELFTALFGAFQEVEFLETFAVADSQAFVWRGRIGGRSITGMDLLHLNERGQIAEVWVFIRPLVSLAAFAAGAAGPLAAHRGPVRHVLARILTLPLRPMFRLIDVVASRLTMRPIE